MKVITISTSGEDKIKRLLQSAASFNITIEIIGDKKRYESHNDKTLILLDFLGTQNPDETILYIDGYDCIFLRGLDYIKAEYEKFDHPFVMSTEQNFNCDFPLRQKLKFYSKLRNAPGPYKFLNAGCWIGKAGYVKNILQQIGNGVEDQTMLNKYLSNNRDKIALDHDHSIFTCTGGRAGLEERDYSNIDNLLRNNIKMTLPAVFHAPGRNFPGLNKILSMLKLKYERQTETKEMQKSYAYSKWMNHLNATILPDNFLFHLILKTGVLILTLIVLIIILY